MNRRSLSGSLILLALATSASGCGGQPDEADVPGEARSALLNDPASGTYATNPLEIPLVVVLWQDVNYGGHKRIYIYNDPYLGAGYVERGWCSPEPTCTGNATGTQIGSDFNDTASAVGVHPGPNYDSYRARTGHEPTVTLWTDRDYAGTPLRLAAGAYANLGDFGMNDAVSSVSFDDNGSQALPIVRTANPAATFKSIPWVVQLHSASFDRLRHWQEGDNFITLVESSANLDAEYGFANSASFVELLRGPNFADASSVTLYSQPGYAGAVLSASTAMPYQWDIFSAGFNDCTNSVKLTSKLIFHGPPLQP
jgi:hypothetical protein